MHLEAVDLNYEHVLTCVGWGPKGWRLVKRQEVGGAGGGGGGRGGSEQTHVPEPEMFK